MGHSLISESKFRQLYELTVLVQAGGRRVRSGGPWPRGREAVLAGVMADLRSGDVLVAESASWMSESVQSRLPISIRVPVATTMANLIVESLSSSTIDRLRNNARMTVIFGAAGGRNMIPAEARALASAAGLPVLFVEAGSAKGAPGPSNSKPVAVDAMPSIPVDSSDVIAIYRVAHESITRARQGNGPTQILCAHWQSGANGRDGMNRSNAVERLERWLVTRGLPVLEWREELATQSNATCGSSSAAAVFEATHQDSVTGSQPFAQANIE